MTRASLREYAAVQRERYLAATRAEKGALLDEVVAVTGLHRKAAIRLLRRTPRPPTAPSRAGRPRVYGPAVGRRRPGAERLRLRAAEGTIAAKMKKLKGGGSLEALPSTVSKVAIGY